MRLLHRGILRHKLRKKKSTSKPSIQLDKDLGRTHGCIWLVHLTSFLTLRAANIKGPPQSCDHLSNVD